VTFSDLERLYGHHYVLFHRERKLSEPTASNSLKLSTHSVNDKNEVQGFYFWQHGYGVYSLEFARSRTLS